MNALLALLVLLLAAGALAYHRVGLRTASTTLLALLALLTLWFGLGWGLALLWLVLLAILVPLNVEPWRIELTRPVFAFLKRALPRISQTEQEALEAGDVWWDAELFSGKPDWSRLLDLPAPRLSEREQAFLDGPVETLCRMLDDWDITHHRKDLPPEVWDFIRRERFFGMIIPEEHGGLGFSALAHSEVVMKIASRSITAAVTVMVPNSLGPAKLLLHYGTPKQKEYYLPRLARGEEIPCFALTAPEAGSDAAAIPDTGVVCRGE
ncbi:MAG: acyl-CoA dehydrogenase, partial [Gammaproteobacteria bacterium]